MSTVKTNMLIRKLKSGFLLLLSAVWLIVMQPVTQAWAESSDKVHTEMSVAKMYRDEKGAMRHYSRGKYEKAFHIFEKTAELGLKKSQYYLGIMYLKGQHVEPSIETGMAWLGVAAEIELEEWVSLYDQIYVTLDDAQRSLVRSKLSDYIDRYGMVAQKIICEKRTKLGSRKKQLHCDKKTLAVKVPEIFS